METKKLLDALLKAQSEFPKIPQNGSVSFQGRQFRYAELNDILNAIGPVLRKNGLFIFHKIVSGDAGRDDTLMTYLSHPASDSDISTQFSIPKCGKAQDVGGWITYGRRYCIETILGVCSQEDSDGPENDSADYGKNKNTKQQGPGVPTQPTGTVRSINPPRATPPSPAVPKGPSKPGTGATIEGAFAAFAKGPQRVEPSKPDTSFNFGPLSEEDVP